MDRGRLAHRVVAVGPWVALAAITAGAVLGPGTPAVLGPEAAAMFVSFWMIVANQVVQKQRREREAANALQLRDQLATLEPLSEATRISRSQADRRARNALWRREVRYEEEDKTAHCRRCSYTAVGTVTDVFADMLAHLHEAHGLEPEQLRPVQLPRTRKPVV